MLTRRVDCLSGRASSTPLPHGTVLSKTMCPATEEERKEMQTVPYRPDIMFATNLCARYMANPGRQHWEALKHILKYLARLPHGCLHRVLCTGSASAQPFHRVRRL